MIDIEYQTGHKNKFAPLECLIAEIPRYYGTARMFSALKFDIKCLVISPTLLLEKIAKNNHTVAIQ